MRCSILLTGRISPDKPTPAMQVVESIATSMFEDNIALITAKSIAGSSIFNPPKLRRHLLS